MLSSYLVTFCVSCRRRKMYCGHARLCVCVSVRGRTSTLLHGPVAYVLFIFQYFTEGEQLRVYLLIHTFNAPFIWFTTEKIQSAQHSHVSQRQQTRSEEGQSKNWQLTDTLRSMSFVSVVTDTIVTTRCVLTRRVFRTPAVVFRTLVNICTTSI